MGEKKKWLDSAVIDDCQCSRHSSRVEIESIGLEKERGNARGIFNTLFLHYSCRTLVF